METVQCRSLEEFNAKLVAKGLTPESNEEFQKSNLAQTYSHPLFRGQSNPDWKLSTTLEREGHFNMFLGDYFGKVRDALKNAPNIGGISWKIPSVHEYNTFIDLSDPLRLYKFSFPFPTPDRDSPGGTGLIDFMTFLRHHDDPSPFLDWSGNPKVALYFAFRESPQRDEVAIFVYQECIGNPKLSRLWNPKIHTIGHHGTTHARHVNQVSWYTVCYKMDKNPVPRLVYAPHESVFSNGMRGQDQLWKFTLPSRLRSTILQDLESEGISADHLFGNIES